MDDRELDIWGPGIVLQPDNFGGQYDDMADGGDRFAERQDAIHHMNVGLAGTDAAASELLSIVPRQREDYDFSAEMEKLFRRQRNEILKGLRHPADRSEAIQDFEELMRRYMGRAGEMNLDSRVRSRAAGAEQALERIKAAAIADPDGLPDRFADADLLLGRMVEAGVDASAAATRAGQFRGEVGSAILDDLAERDPRGAIARLDGGLFDGLMSAEDKLPLREDFARIAEADDRARQRRASLSEQSEQFEAAARRRSTVVALASALRSDEADEGAIERAFYRGEIDADDARDLRTRLDQIDVDRRARGVEIDHLDTAIKSGISEPIGRSWPQEIVDSWWTSEQARSASASIYIPDCFGVTGKVPMPYIGNMRRQILSGLPDDAAAAGLAFRELRVASNAAADAVLDGLPVREARSLIALADYADIGLPPDRISELAAEQAAHADSVEPLAEDPDESDEGVDKLTPDMLAPTGEKIDAKVWKKVLGYDDEGPSELVNASEQIPDGMYRKALATRDDAFAAAEKAQQDHGLTKWEKDAFQHAYWSYKLTELLGPEVAKTIGDAHERHSFQMEKVDWQTRLGLRKDNGLANPPDQALMDLYNNYVGRQIFKEAAQDREWQSPAETIMQALRSGRLQLEPFKLK